MNFIPSDKFDIQACKQLEVTPQDKVQPFISDLLVWIQDYNWPVAPFVKQKLIQFDNELINPLKSVLSGDDVIWKYFILTELLPEVKNNVLSSLQPELKQEVDKLALKYIT